MFHFLNIIYHIEYSKANRNGANKVSKMGKNWSNFATHISSSFFTSHKFRRFKPKKLKNSSKKLASKNFLKYLVYIV